MKNKSLKFNILNWFEESQSEIVKLQHTIKGLLATACTVTWVNSTPENTVLVTIIGAILIEVIGCLRIEDKNNA